MTIKTFDPPSSNILAVEYDTETREMRVTFQDTAIYAYSQVPEEVYDAFSRAPSAGSYFWRMIRNRYAYRQV